MISSASRRLPELQWQYTTTGRRPSLLATMQGRKWLHSRRSPRSLCSCGGGVRQAGDLAGELQASVGAWILLKMQMQVARYQPLNKAKCSVHDARIQHHGAGPRWLSHWPGMLPTGPLTHPHLQVLAIVPGLAEAKGGPLPTHKVLVGVGVITGWSTDSIHQLIPHPRQSAHSPGITFVQSAGKPRGAACPSGLSSRLVMM